MNINPKSALGIFFRVPALGKVKRRLAAEIGEAEALKVYESMLTATINNALRLQGIDIYGFYEGVERFQKEYLKKLPLILQQGVDLGERMHNAIQWLFDNEYQKVLLVGADSPDLPLSFIVEAFQKLNFYELVIGPSEDGGYYLIGMERPLGVLFKNIEWGSDTVLQGTISRAHVFGISYFLLPEWYDIDDRKSLNRLRLSKKQAHPYEVCRIKN